MPRGSVDFLPVVIIGAPRSGTNMLRDVLCSLDDIATWPCDEINYIWRHGNISHKSDEFEPSMAHPGVAAYIRNQFAWVARKYKARIVVEKTCANSLRVPFVDAVLPDAKYIFIRRDGIDAVGSAMKRWTADLDIPYLMRKVRFTPLSDLPYYGGRYVWNRIYRLFSKEDRLAFWGPQLDNMSELLVEYSLDEVCALQWQACVEKSANALSNIHEDRWIEVAYEDFVKEPESELQKILSFLQLDLPAEALRESVMQVRSDSVGRGRAALDEAALERLETLVHDTMQRFGYAQ
jgi:hypothetical protein